MPALARLGALGAATLVLAACTTSSSPAPTPSAAPTPTPVPNPTFATCTADQLELTAGNSGAAAGSSILNFTADLVGDTPCLINTWPAATILDGIGAVVVRSEPEPDALPRTTVLETSREFHLIWASSCGPPPSRPFTALLGLVDHADVTLDIPKDFGPSGCMGAAMSVVVAPGWDY